MVRAHARRLLTLLLLSLAGCGEKGSPTDPMTSVASTVILATTTLSFSSFEDTQQLIATVRDQNGAIISEASVTWASSASNVASVSSTGLIAAVADGTATVTATSGSASGTVSVTVQQVAASITLSPSSLVLAGPGDGCPSPRPQSTRAARLSRTPTTQRAFSGNLMQLH